MIILGIILITIGALMVVKTDWFLSNFGRLSWFEDKLGTEGGSRLGYKLLGIILIFVGIVMLSGNGTNFFVWLLSPLMPKGM